MELELNEVVALTVAKCSYSVQNCFYVTDHKFSASGREDVDVQMLGIGECCGSMCAEVYTCLCVYLKEGTLHECTNTHMLLFNLF